MENSLDISLTDRFLQSVAEFADHPAICLNDKTYSYAELLKIVSALAGMLREYDPDPNCKMSGVFAYRSLAAYSGLMAILFSDKGYVPFNPMFPAERNLRMFNLSGVRTLIVDRRCEKPARSLIAASDRKLLVLMPEHEELPRWTRQLDRHSFISAKEILSFSGSLEKPTTDPQQMAYLLFTSGSTGVPKGVMVSHRNVSSYIKTMIERYGPGPGDRFSQLFELTFDLSVHDILLSWLSGACLCPVPEISMIGLVDFVNKNRLTFWFSVPSTIGMMRKLRMLKPGIFPNLKWSLFCGEPLPAQSASLWQEAAPNSILENLYGPTEATIAITLYRWESEFSHKHCHNGIVPIGKPYPGQQASVIDDNLRILNPGEEGELCLSGSQVSLGYWHNEQETEKRFVVLPGLKDKETRWYRTGDIVKWDEAAGYIYLGRLDRQVKIRGHRVEIQEIEKVIREVSKTDLVAVIGWPQTESGADGVIAFSSGSKIPKDRILDHCRKHLPEYMIPQDVFSLANLPLNAAGKVDYNKLGEIRKEMDNPKS